MIQMWKNKARTRDADVESAQDVPAEVNDTSAEVSEDAACCVADIDDVLADMDDALPEESEEDKARREGNALFGRWMSGEIGFEEYERERRVLKAQYAHLNLGSCWC